MTVRVITPPIVEPLTLDETKLHLRETGTEQDELIEMLIVSARQHAEEYTRRAFVYQELELSLPSFPIQQTLIDQFPQLYAFAFGQSGASDQTIWLPRPPLQTIRWVKYIDVNGNQQTVDPTLYQVDTAGEPGRVKPTYLNWWQPTRNDFNAVQIRYYAGYTPISGSPLPVNYLYANLPEGIRQWMRVRIAQLYKNREALVIVRGSLLDIPRDFVDGLLDPYVIGRLGTQQ